LANPSPELAEFSAAFRRFAEQILSKQRQQAEMASASLIQQSFLPKESSVDFTQTDFEISAKIRPAREVGGDFFDFFALDADRMAIVIGDVCGKGIPASIFYGSGCNRIAHGNSGTTKCCINHRAHERDTVPRQCRVIVCHHVLWCSEFTKRNARLL